MSTCRVFGFMSHLDLSAPPWCTPFPAILGVAGVSTQCLEETGPEAKGSHPPSLGGGGSARWREVWLWQMGEWPAERDTLHVLSLRLPLEDALGFYRAVQLAA